MADQPTGTVTLLFTDIEGSTRLLDRLGAKRYGEALEQHRQLLRQAFERHGGYEVDCEGDAFFVAFANPREAVAAAGEAQQALASAGWPDEGAIRVRMGLHTGEPLAAPPRYVGMDVHKAARVMAAGHGGQVVVSSTTQRLLYSAVGVVALGEHRLKDLSQPEPLYQLEIDGLPNQFPALKTLGNRANNLPVVATPFIGREEELSQVLQMLVVDDVRLLTLTGLGGIGKTRLALQAAADSLDSFPGGVFWVPLASVRDPALVAASIAEGLSVREEPGEPLGATLTRYLAEKELLLVLDNFEHVIEAAPKVAEILRAAHKVRVLTTSREALRLQGEQLYDVPPLALPQAGDAIALEAFDAVQLFVARARASDSSFGVTENNSAAIGEVVRRLDGIPLALELAAARARVLTPKMILERLDNRLRLLTGGTRDADERQRTLRATIQWSYDLLSAEEQALLARLGVFVGGCRLDAAEAVGNPGEVLALDVLDGVSSLVDKSLLRRRMDPDDAPRYSMLETIREYALSLHDPAGLAAAREAHARYFLTVAEQAEEGSRREHHAESYEHLDPDAANLRAALDWSDESGNRELGLRLATALGGYWCARGRVAEGRDRLEQVQRTHPEMPPRALLWLCLLRLLSAWDARAVRTDVQRALGALERLSDTYGIAQAWNLLGRVEGSGLGDMTAAEDAWLRALDYAEQGGYVAERAESMGWLMVTAMFGPLPTSEGITRCEAFMEQAADDPKVQAFARVELAVLRAMRGEFARADELLFAGRNAFTELGMNVWAANTAQEAFYVEMLSGNPARAVTALRESYEALEEMGERGFLSTIAAFLAHALYATDEYEEAHFYSQQSEHFAAADDVFSQVLWRTARAKVTAQGGAFVQAEALARDAIALAEETELLNIRADAHNDLAELLRLADRPREAAAALDTAAVRYELKENLTSLHRARSQSDALRGEGSSD